MRKLEEGLKTFGWKKSSVRTEGWSSTLSGYQWEQGLDWPTMAGTSKWKVEGPWYLEGKKKKKKNISQLEWPCEESREFVTGGAALLTRTFKT